MPERQQLFMSPREAAIYASVSTITIRRRISDGSLPASRVGKGRLIRIKRSDLDAMLRTIPSAKVG